MPPRSRRNGLTGKNILSSFKSKIGRLDLVKTFLKEDGNLRTGAGQMERGFAWACQYGRTKVVKFLLERGLKVDAMPHGITGLHWAAYTARVDIVKLLTSATTLKGFTPRSSANSRISM